jgi:hypothetical protein
MHVVHHCHQHVVVQFDARRTRTVAQGLIELVRQDHVVTHPLFGGAVRQIEMQPDKAGLAGVCQPLLVQPQQSLCGIEWTPLAGAAKLEATDQAGRISAVACGRNGAHAENL